MKIRILVMLTMSIVLFWSCTPEVDEDTLTISSRNNSVYALYDAGAPDGLVAGLIKTRYISEPYRNGVSLGDTSYSANTLFMKINGTKDWTPVENLNNDSNLYVTEWDNINETISIRYSDTLLFVKHLGDASLDTVIIVDPSAYPDVEYFTSILSVDSTSIDSINNGQRYKTYRDWKDDMINLYR